MITTISVGIAPPIKSFNTPAKNATGNVFCFSPSTVAVTGTKKE